MSKDHHDLPTRKIVTIQPEVLRPLDQTSNGLTERQLDAVIQSAGQAAKDLGEIIKGIVNIIERRANTEHDVLKIEAETRRIQVLASVEIERIIAQGGNIHTRSEAAHKLLGQLIELARLIPNEDVSSRGRLIDSISSILGTVLNEKNQ